MQAAFRAMSNERGMWAGATVATNQDLSGLFVARCVELYLRQGGRFGYVMPWGTLSRRQYAGFRTGDYPGKVQPVKVAFDRPWDLHLVKPSFFPVPASVVFGTRADPPSPLDNEPEVWSGRFATSTASKSQAEAHLTKGLEPPRPRSAGASPYAARFSQGATVVPRLLFLVEPDGAAPLGAGAGRAAIRSRRTAGEKKPWKSLPTKHGTVEREFVRPLFLGDSVLPFRCLDPFLAAIPWDGTRLLHGADERLDLYPGLAAWWRSAESTWLQHRSSERLTLVQRLDYRRGLSQQFPAPNYRVLYATSGMYMAAAFITDPNAVIDTKLYWGAAQNAQEARYLCAILNAPVTTSSVRPLQSRGEHNPRDFHKYVFQLPIPLYDEADPVHAALVALAERADRVAAVGRAASRPLRSPPATRS